MNDFFFVDYQDNLDLKFKPVTLITIYFQMQGEIVIQIWEVNPMIGICISIGNQRIKIMPWFSQSTI